MQHGVFSSSEVWTENSVEKAPAYVLASLGYDIWLGNNRGNKYSRSSIHLDPDRNPG